MTISRIHTPLFIVLALLSTAVVASGQQLQRSMVYHVNQPKPATQTPARKPNPHANANRSVTPVAPKTRVAQTTQPHATTKASYVSTRINSAPVHAKSAATHNTTPAVTTIATTNVAKTAGHTAPRAAATMPAEAALRKESSVSRIIDVPHASTPRKRFDRWFYASSAVFAAGAILDHTSTTAGMKKVGAREANPLLRNADGGFSPSKHMALSAGIYGASLLLQKKHPRAANVLRLVGGFAKIGVSIHNRQAAQGRPDLPTP